MTVLATVLASSGTNSTSTVYDVEPGLLGFLVVAVLCLVCVFLFRSMNKQFRKIGPKPEDTEAEAASAPLANTGARQRPLRGLAAHRAAMAAAEAEAAKAESAPGRSDANRD